MHCRCAPAVDRPGRCRKRRCPRPDEDDRTDRRQRGFRGSERPGRPRQSPDRAAGPPAVGSAAADAERRERASRPPETAGSALGRRPAGDRPAPPDRAVERRCQPPGRDAPRRRRPAGPGCRPDGAGCPEADRTAAACRHSGAARARARNGFPDAAPCARSGRPVDVIDTAVPACNRCPPDAATAGAASQCARTRATARIGRSADANSRGAAGCVGRTDCGSTDAADFRQRRNDNEQRLATRA